MTTPLETIEQVVHIDAAPETVWSFWTEPARLCEWWGIEADAVAATGGVFRVVMEAGPVMLGEFLELDPPRRLLFSFGWEGGAPGGALPPGSSRVEVVLDDQAGGTRLTLRHELPATHAVDHAKGWSFYVGDRLVDVARATPRSVGS